MTASDPKKESMSDREPSADLATRASGGPLPRGERRLLLAFMAVLLMARVASVFRLPIDTDETQHLHVAWEWTQGHVQYRDFFDNHAPLFHLLTAPFVAAVGERVEILVLARLLMLPLFAATVWLVLSIGRRLFGARVGAWSAVLCGLLLGLLPTSVEFRTDQLWVVAWLLALRVWIGGRWSLRRAFSGGLLVGIAFAVSLKTSLLLLALAAAPLLVAAVCPEARRGWSARRAVQGVLALAGGALAAPAVVVVGFASAGAFHDLVYCTVLHNLLPMPRGTGEPFRIPLLVVGSGALFLSARAFTRRWLPAGDRLRPLLLPAAAGIHMLVLTTIWPHFELEDFLPSLCIVSLALATMLVPALDRFGGAAQSSRGASAVVFAAALCLAVGGVAAVPLLAGGTDKRLRELADVLRITDPSDYVMDAKGDAIFRERPFRPVLELLTNHRIAEGLIEDRIAERCIATATGVVYGPLNRFPPQGARFVESHYVGDGRVRIAGHRLAANADAGVPLPFSIAIPGRYVVVSGLGAAMGTLDGAPYGGARFLTPGPHVFVPEGVSTHLAVLWAKAIERGFSPFFKEGGRVR